MNKVWKWILGILLALVVVAALAGLVLLWMHHPALMAFGPRAMHPGPSTVPFGSSGPRVFQGDHGPQMHGRHFFPFFGGLLLLAGLVKLAFFGALLYGAYWLGRRNARLVMDPSTPAAPAVKPDQAPKSGRKVAGK
jgi:hypothetical protein